MSTTTTHNVTPSGEWAIALLEVLRAQHQLVGRLLQQAQSQQELVATGRTDQLLDLLAKRQAIIDEFTQSQAQLSALTNLPGGLSARLNAASPQQRDEIQSLIENVGQQLADVMQRDEEDQESLRSGRERAKQELVELGAARQARNAYQSPPSKANAYADEQG